MPLGPRRPFSKRSPHPRGVDCVLRCEQHEPFYEGASSVLLFSSHCGRNEDAALRFTMIVMRRFTTGSYGTFSLQQKKKCRIRLIRCCFHPCSLGHRCIVYVRLTTNLRSKPGSRAVTEVANARAELVVREIKIRVEPPEDPEGTGKSVSNFIFGFDFSQLQMSTGHLHLLLNLHHIQITRDMVSCNITYSCPSTSKFITLSFQPSFL